MRPVPYFCEENIWHLCAAQIANGTAAETLAVIILTNAGRQIPLLAQQTGRQQDGLVFWDYHVILRQTTADGTLIYDYDSRLPFPCALQPYCRHTFPDAQRLPAEFRIQTRMIPAASYLQHFHSDRSHMRDAAGKPRRPFPPWPCIQPQAGIQAIDLQDYLDMARELDDGSRVSEVEELRG